MQWAACEDGGTLAPLCVARGVSVVDALPCGRHVMRYGQWRLRVSRGKRTISVAGMKLAPKPSAVGLAQEG